MLCVERVMLRAHRAVERRGQLMALTEEQAALCRSWLKHYDWQLYGNRAKAKWVMACIERDVGVKLKYGELTPLLNECEAMGRRRLQHRRKRTATSIDSLGWEKAMNAVQLYGSKCYEPGMTLAGFTRFLLYEGFPVNEHIVREVLALRKVSLPESVEPWKRGAA